MYVLSLLLFAAVAPAPMPLSGGVAHERAIKELADIAALSQVIISHCPNMLIDAYKLATIRDHQRYDPSKDSRILMQEVRLAVAAFEREIEAATSAQAWCNANFELYGPAGKSIPGVMIRKGE